MDKKLKQSILQDAKSLLEQNLFRGNNGHHPQVMVHKKDCNIEIKAANYFDGVDVEIFLLVKKKYGFDKLEISSNHRTGEVCAYLDKLTGRTHADIILGE